MFTENTRAHTHAHMHAHLGHIPLKPFAGFWFLCIIHLLPWDFCSLPWLTHAGPLKPTNTHTHTCRKTSKWAGGSPRCCVCARALKITTLLLHPSNTDLYLPCSHDDQNYSCGKGISEERVEKMCSVNADLVKMFNNVPAVLELETASFKSATERHKVPRPPHTGSISSSVWYDCQSLIIILRWFLASESKKQTIAQLKSRC